MSDLNDLEMFRTFKTKDPLMGTWQPIETAPRDGTEILVWRPKELHSPDNPAHVGIDKWSGQSWWRSRLYQQPTHWMPLPSGPLK